MPVQVVVRVRPATGTPSAEDRGPSCLRVDNDRNAVVVQEQKVFSADYVAGEESTQSEIFDAVGSGIVSACLDGYNGTVLAYGQTGAGKTYTMEGPPQSESAVLQQPSPEPAATEGLIMRMLRGIFEIQHPSRGASDGMAGRVDTELSCKCSFYEIYNETIIDLLLPTSVHSSAAATAASGAPDSSGAQSAPGLTVRENAQHGVYVQGLQEEVVCSSEDAFTQLRRGRNNRTVAATAMNAESSRSHSVFTVHIRIRPRNTDGDEGCAPGMHEEEGCVCQDQGPESLLQRQQKGHAAVMKSVKVSRLVMVDLAGSERQKVSNTAGARLREAAAINKSLSALGNVIVALTEGHSHIPYRDSKLTLLLRESLGGNAKTAMIANVSPAVSNLDETLSTLQFCQRVQLVTNRATVNEVVLSGGDVASLQAEIRSLKQQLLLVAAIQTPQPAHAEQNHGVDASAADQADENSAAPALKAGVAAVVLSAEAAAGPGDSTPSLDTPSFVSRMVGVKRSLPEESMQTPDQSPTNHDDALLCPSGSGDKENACPQPKVAKVPLAELSMATVIVQSVGLVGITAVHNPDGGGSAASTPQQAPAAGKSPLQEQLPQAPFQPIAVEDGEMEMGEQNITSVGGGASTVISPLQEWSGEGGAEPTAAKDAFNAGASSELLPSLIVLSDLEPLEPPSSSSLLAMEEGHQVAEGQAAAPLGIEVDDTTPEANDADESAPSAAEGDVCEADSKTDLQTQNAALAEANSTLTTEVAGLENQLQLELAEQERLEDCNNELDEQILYLETQLESDVTAREEVEGRLVAATLKVGQYQLYLRQLQHRQRQHMQMKQQQQQLQQQQQQQKVQQQAEQQEVKVSQASVAAVAVAAPVEVRADPDAMPHEEGEEDNLLQIDAPSQTDFPFVDEAVVQQLRDQHQVKVGKLESALLSAHTRLAEGEDEMENKDGALRKADGRNQQLSEELSESTALVKQLQLEVAAMAARRATSVVFTMSGSGAGSPNGVVSADQARAGLLGTGVDRMVGATVAAHLNSNSHRMVAESSSQGAEDDEVDELHKPPHVVKEVAAAALANVVRTDQQFAATAASTAAAAVASSVDGRVFKAATGKRKALGQISNGGVQAEGESDSAPRRSTRQRKGAQ